MEPTDMEKDAAREILVYFFGIHAEFWPINDRVIDKVGEMLLKERQCAKVMDALPRPGAVDKGYIKRQLRSIARRLAGGGHSYDVCRTAIKYGWERVVYLASQGL